MVLILVCYSALRLFILKIINIKVYAKDYLIFRSASSIPIKNKKKKLIAFLFFRQQIRMLECQIMRELCAFLQIKKFVLKENNVPLPILILSHGGLFRRNLISGLSLVSLEGLRHQSRWSSHRQLGCKRLASTLSSLALCACLL